MVQPIIIMIALAWAPYTFCPTLINNATVPITLTSSGRYIMTEDIAYTPVASVPAITISANNVVLDMLNYTVTQVGGFGFSVTGIQVSGGVSRAKIINGGVSNCTQAGISTGTGCSQVVVDSVNITGCGVRGIEFVGSVAFPILESSINNCSLLNNCTVATADNVITLTNVNFSGVGNCSLDLNGSTAITGTFAGIRVTGFRNELINISISDNTGNTDARGISLNNAVGTIVEDCVVNNIVAASGGSSVRAFFCEASTTSTANLFQKCIARACTGVFAVDGFLSSTGCDDNYFQDCFSVLNQATAATGAVHGFRAINNARNSFTNCQARNNTAANSTVASPLYGAYGFKLDTTTAANIINSFAVRQSASTRAVGIGVLGGTAGNTISGNTCARNGTAAGTTTAGSGFGLDFQGTNGAGGVYDTNSCIQNMAANNTNGAAQYSNFPANALTDSVPNRNLSTAGLQPFDNVGLANA